VSGDWQHWQPAALIGGFGVPARTGRLRHATVAVRWKASDRIRDVSAEYVAGSRATYRLRTPPPGVDKDAVDHVWGPLERELPLVVAQLIARALGARHRQTLFEYAAAAGVRHPVFVRQVQAWHADRGLRVPEGDAVQLQRLGALRNELRRVPSWRWRVLHATPTAPRFMTNDRGWIYVGQHAWPSRALFMPMSPRVAILGYLDHPSLPPRRSPFSEHLELRDMWIRWFNAALWNDDDPIVAVIAHPSDRELLRNLPRHEELHLDSHGPYRHRDVGGLFD
jgi:hypothetical protein